VYIAGPPSSGRFFGAWTRGGRTYGNRSTARYRILGEAPGFVVKPAGIKERRIVPFYESVYIARPDISATQVEALTQRLTEIVETNGGKVTKNEYWGLKNLAYRIKKNRKGHYSLLNIDAPSDALSELERNMRLSEDVLRYLTVKVDVLDENPSIQMSRGGRDERGRDRGGRGGFGGRGKEREGGRDREEEPKRAAEPNAGDAKPAEKTAEEPVAAPTEEPAAVPAEKQETEA
jgi:small subunit ribosomal protein S6